VRAQERVGTKLVAEGGEEVGLKREVPAVFVDRGAVSSEEWLWRANKNLLVRKGRAIGGVGVSGGVGKIEM